MNKFFKYSSTTAPADRWAHLVEKMNQFTYAKKPALNECTLSTFISSLHCVSIIQKSALCNQLGVINWLIS